MEYKKLPSTGRIATTIDKNPTIDTLLLLFLGTDKQQYAFKIYLKYIDDYMNKADLSLMCMYIRNNKYNSQFLIGPRH